MTKHKKIHNSEADYQTGYRKPPKHSQFKPGTSGNPKGRPKGRKNLLPTFFEIMHEKIPIREAGTLRTVTRFEAMIRMLWQKAFHGDAKAAATIIAQMKELRNYESSPPHTMMIKFVGPDEKKSDPS